MLEQEDFTSDQNRYNIPVLKLKKDILRELQRPCSRFRFNVGSVSRDFFFARLADWLDPFAKQEFVMATNLSANWQAFLRYLYDNKVTASTSISSQPVRNDLPHVHTAVLYSVSGRGDSDGQEVNRYGLGASYSDPEEAISKAFGELLERYFSARYRKHELITATYRRLSSKRIGPRPLDIFSLNDYKDWQKKRFPLLNRDPDATRRWVGGYNVTKGKHVYLPAQLVYWNYLVEGDTYLGECNTSGIAGHFTRDEAIYAALLELIQRDGFMLHWLTNEAPHRIDPETISDRDVRALLSDFKESGVEIHLLDISSDLCVPTCLTIIVDERGGRHEMHVAAGIGFNAREIFLSAISECIAVLNWQQYRSGETIELEDSYVPFEKHIGHMERLRVWRTKKMIDAIRPFLSGDFVSESVFMRGMTRSDGVDTRLAYLQQNLASRGDRYDLYVHEFEHPLLREVGFHVVRAIVPALMSLYLAEDMATLGAERLHSVPKALGWNTLDTLRPWPHPFP